MISDRMLRAARLETGLYEEVEADTAATQQALLVVVIAAIAAGIGQWFRPGGGVGGLILGLLATVVGWIVWSYVTYWIGTKFFGGTATPGELLRTLGFANAPGVLRVFGFIPVLGGLFNLVAVIWMLVAGVIAVRQALDFTTGKAIATVVIGWLVVVILTVVVGLLTAVGSFL